MEVNYAKPVGFENNMVDIIKDNVTTDLDYVMDQFHKHQRDVFPQVRESLTDFIWRNKNEKNSVSLCSRCTVLFDEEAGKH